MINVWLSGIARDPRDLDADRQSLRKNIGRFSVFRLEVNRQFVMEYAKFASTDWKSFRFATSTEDNAKTSVMRIYQFNADRSQHAWAS